MNFFEHKNLVQEGDDGNDDDEDDNDNGAVQVVQLLLAAGASPRARATSDWTPVHFAAREGHVDICRMLVTRGGRVDGATTGGWSPLMVAAAFNRLETASFLLGAGADRRKTNNDGASAEVSCHSCHTSCHYKLSLRGDRSRQGICPDGGDAQGDPGAQATLTRVASHAPRSPASGPGRDPGESGDRRRIESATLLRSRQS